MDSMVGADPDQLDALGQRLSRGADLLETIRTELSAHLGSTTWCGSDAELFHGDWSGHLSSFVSAAANVLREASQKVHFEASQQRDASGVAAQAGGGGGGGGGASWTLFGGLTGLAVGEALHSGLGIAGSIEGKIADIGKVARFLDPFANADDVKAAAGVINTIDKAPEWIAGPLRGTLGFLSRTPGLGLVSDLARSPVGKALPVVGAVISGASIGSDVYNITQGGWTTQNQGNLLSDLGSAALGSGWPPLMLAGGADWLGTKLDPTWPQDAWRGATVLWNDGAGAASSAITSVVQTTENVANTAVTVSHTVVNDVTSAPGAVFNFFTHLGNN